MLEDLHEANKTRKENKVNSDSDALIDLRNAVNRKDIPEN